MPASVVHLANLTTTWVRAAAVVSAATDLATYVDLSGYEGVVTFIWTGGAITGTGDCTLTDCATSGGSYVAITGAAATQVTSANQVRSISVDTRNVKRYVIASTVVGTTSWAFGICLIGQKKVTG